MCARVLPWSTQPSNSNSNSNSATSFSLPASASASAPSVPFSSSSPGSPPSPSVAFPAPADSQASVSWPPPPPSSASGPASAGASLLSAPPGQPSTSTPISTTPSQGGGSAGTTSSANLPFPGANGVVVVGVIGRVEHEVSQFLDRLLDCHLFGALNRAAEQWQENGEQFVSASDVTGGIARERKQRKDGHRSRSTEAAEDGVLEGEGSLTSSGGSATDDVGQKSGTRSGKGHVKNGHYGRRREDVEAGSRSEKRHGGGEDSNTRKDAQFEIWSGRGGDEQDSGKTREAWKEGQWSVPWLLSKFKYHYDVEKGTVYVQFTWGVPPLDCLTESALRTSVGIDGLFGTLENHEADGMRGLLFMFSVCHVIMMVQEGASFDPQVLRVFRLLQTAKHSLAPFVKTQILPGLLPAPSSAVRPSPLKPLSLGTRHNFGRSGVAGQNSSTVALMSGSTPVLIPGQCTPVLLFVYLEDMAEPPPGASSPQTTIRADGIPDRYLPTYLPRQSSFLKPASSGLASSRTNKKSEPGLRKKLQASLEAQLRFLLKKCRTVTGFGDTTPLGSGVAPGMGPRGPGSSVSSFQGVGGGSLFVLDPSRAVILLDRMANHQTDALDAATDAMEAMFSDVDLFGFGSGMLNMPGKDGLENLLWDLGANAATTAEDLQAVKDFVSRQAEILRGKGGISGNAGSGGTGGVGMVAAAAAAAAASAASGLGGATNKPINNPPELPTFSSWLSACRVLSEALSARLAEDVERDASQKSSDVTHSATKYRAASPTRPSGSVGKIAKTKPTIESSLVFLDTGSHVNLKFSAAWCERVLPSALDVYLKGLPPSYPTNLHISQLEKALRRFHSMVRGQAVPLYAEKLKECCEALWHSGRQLCDAESLTGKPCIHQVHDVLGTGASHAADGRVKDSSSNAVGSKLISMPHSSGVVFLHACACGRSRKLRKDPFDFESANVTFRFPNCEDMLPSVVIQSPSENLPSGGSPWSLVRLGMSRYYQPEVGLVQSGFLPKHNFLSSWDIPLVYSTTEGLVDDPPVISYKEEVAEFMSPKPIKTTASSVLRGAKPGPQAKASCANPHGRVPDKGYGASKTRATSANADAKKGFTDSTSRVNYGGESAFPPLPEKQEKPVIAIAKPLKQQGGGKEKKNRASAVQDDENAVPFAFSTGDVVKKSQPNLGVAFGTEAESVGSNVRDVSGSGSELNPNSVTKHVRLFIGFEYECPHGHRFLLSDNQPERLTPSSAPSSSKTGAGPSAKLKKHDRIELRVKDSSSLTGSQHSEATVKETTGGSSVGPPQNFPPKWTQKGMKIPDKMQYWSVQDGHGDGLSLLNSNLPIYMHCPYCKTSGEDSNSNKTVTFGGTISQLQRVFVVTPSLPLQLGSFPVVEFEDISKPSKTMLKLTPGNEIELPPDSFLCLRLPFVYYSQVKGDPQKPLLVNRSQPEWCAWLAKNTALYLMSKGGTIEPTMSGSSG